MQPFFFSSQKRPGRRGIDQVRGDHSGGLWRHGQEKKKPYTDCKKRIENGVWGVGVERLRGGRKKDTHGSPICTSLLRVRGWVQKKGGGL